MNSVYIKLHEEIGEIIRVSLESEHKAAFAQQHAFIHELEVWLTILKDRKEATIFHQASREYQFALFAAVQGMYRHAFMSLRLFMELSFVSIHLSSSELALREWLEQRRDTRWAELLNEEHGLLSNRFAKAFFPELEPYVGSQNSLAARVYRDCSQFVHGNVNTHETVVQVVFSNEVFKEWLSKAEIISDVVIFALCLRFLVDLDHDAISKLEVSVMNRLHHFSEIRAMFGGRTSD